MDKGWVACLAFFAISAASVAWTTWHLGALWGLGSAQKILTDFVEKVERISEQRKSRIDQRIAHLEQKLNKKD